MIHMDAALESIEEVIQRVESDYQFFPDQAGRTLEAQLVLLTADYVLWEISAQSVNVPHATLEAFSEPYGTRLVLSDGNDAQQVLTQLQIFIDGRRKGA